MKKFIMILSGFAMLGASVVGVLNKNTHDAVHAKTTELLAQVSDVTAQLGEAEDKKIDAEQRETQAKDGRNQVSAAVEGLAGQLKVVERAVEDVTAELKKVEIEKKEIDLAVRNQFPDGNIKSAEDLEMSLTMLKDSLTEKQARKAELSTQLGSAAQLKQVQVDKVRAEEKSQMERVQKLGLNSLVATVIAVNKDWGFVMVNAGRQHGVAADSSLLVKRGNSRIARLRIVNLEDTVVVADLVDGSLVQGIDVQPGDNVIFESPN